MTLNDWLEWCLLRASIDYAQVCVGAELCAQKALWAHATIWFVSPQFGITLVWSDD